MARSRHGRTHWSITAGASLCATTSSRRPQRLSSTGEALTYTHTYPQVWIAFSALFDRTYPCRDRRRLATHTTKRTSRPQTLRSPHVSTAFRGVARAFVG